MIDSFKLYGLNVEVKRYNYLVDTLTRSDTRNAVKSNILYQLGISEVISDIDKDSIEYIPFDFRGLYKISRPNIKGYWLLNKIRVDEIEYNKYNHEEIKLLANFTKLACRTKNAYSHELYSVRMLELLVRGFRDLKLVELFYNNPGGTSYTEFEYRLSTLKTDPECYEFAENLPIAQYQRQKYSVYSLLKDLVKYKAEISKDLVDYEHISVSDKEEETNLEEFSDNWYSVTGLLGNSKRANLSLMLSTNGSRCIIRDSRLHTPLLIARIKNNNLRKKLRKSGAVVGNLLYNTDLIIDLTKLQLVGPNDCRVSLKSYINSCIKLLENKRLIKANLDLLDDEEPKTRSKKPIDKEDLKIETYSAITLTCFPITFVEPIKLSTKEEVLKLKEEQIELVKNRRLQTFKIMMSKKLFPVKTTWFYSDTKISFTKEVIKKSVN